MINQLAPSKFASSAAMAEEPPMKRLRTTESQAKSEAERSSASRSSVCAICFNDDGIGCRGEIDCCDHYFCFFCIMEWSKSESRCPVCRRRFSTIRRPGDRLISVSQKDQAREAINVDLYAEISCTVCYGAENDYLTLFCKLCESAAHTYCVGTVPEGDWFCPDCSVSLAEEEEEEEEDWPASYVLSRLNATRKPAKKRKRESNGRVRMLRQSQNVRGRVRAVRDHWDSLRSGDMSLPSSSSAEPPSTERERAASREEEASTSASSNPQVARDRDAFISYDVDKAWKMFDMAKPVVKSQIGGIKIASEASGSSSFLPTLRPPRSFLPPLRQNVNQASSSSGSTSVTVVKQCERSRGRDDDMKSEIQSLVMLNPKLLDRDKRLGEKENNQTKSETLGSRSCLLTVGDGSTKSVCRNVNAASSSANGSTTSISVMKQRTPSISDARSEPNESTGFQKERGHDSMKREIQSLVKLNLKLLDRDKRLGVDSFKKMAQIATHTVMASCGLDHHKKYALLSFQSLACSHVKLPPLQVSKSDMIPTCQKCLESFVKNVVQSIMFEKKEVL